MLFKKPLALGSKNIIGGKDRKKLRERNPRCSNLLQDECLTVTKIQSSKISIYSSDNTPLFFDVDGSGKLYPTVYSLIKDNSLLPCFVVHEQVSSFVLKGKDLMIPGVAIPNSMTAYGDLGLLVGKQMGVRARRNPVPFAVGRCTTENDQFAMRRGKALQVLHVYGDELWKMGSAINVPGFGLKLIKPVTDELPEEVQFYSSIPEQDTDIESDWNQYSASDTDEPSNLPNCNMALSSGAEGIVVPAGNNDNSSLNQTIAAEMSTAKTNSEILKESVVIPVEVMDQLLELCLLEVINNGITFPICSSAVFSQMKQCSEIMQFHPKINALMVELDLFKDIENSSIKQRPSISLDIRKSSFKKSSKFFQSYSKLKLIQLKELRGDLTVVSADPKANMLKQYVPMTKNERSRALKMACIPEVVVANSTEKQELRCLDLFKPTSYAKLIFANTTPDVASEYYTAEQAIQALTNYIKEKELDDNSTVRLNDVLQQLILPKDQRQKLKSDDISQMLKSEIFPKFLDRLQRFHCVQRGEIDKTDNDLIVHSNKLVPIKLQLEKRQGRKTITIVSNIHHFGIDAKQFAETLQRSLASSATLFELTGAAKGKDKPYGVLVQGSFIKEIFEILNTQFAVPKKFINS